jgi:regulator of cell morphogenesis and NO signaling
MFDTEMTISEIVQSDYRTADVFKKYNINYCCSGRISLEEACKIKSIETETIIHDIEEATRNINLPNNLEFSSWNIDFLTDYIINVHHGYLKLALPQLELRLVSFATGHTRKYPELENIQDTFMKLVPLLQSHNLHEEEVIFPYIKQIYIASKRKESYANLFVKTLRKPLDNIDLEHSKINKLLEQLKADTKNYTFPEKACTNHQVLYHKLKELHSDMIQHKHLEINLLFPKAIAIEMELLQQ